MSSVNPNSANDVLPNEDWQNVLLQLEDPKEQANARAVCHDFNGIIDCKALFPEVAKNKKQVAKSGHIWRNIKQLKYKSTFVGTSSGLKHVQQSIKTAKWECVIGVWRADFLTFKDATGKEVKIHSPNMGKISSIALLTNQLFVCCKGRVLIYDISFDKNGHIVVDQTATISSFRNCGN